MNKRQYYINVYRTGGTENFKWNECIPVDNEQDAIKQRRELESMGYRTYTYKYDQYLLIGAPDTYGV